MIVMGSNSSSNASCIDTSGICNLHLSKQQIYGASQIELTFVNNKPNWFLIATTAIATM